MSELIRESIEELQTIAPGHKIIIGVCDNIKVFADREKMHSVISNLVSNAVKYSSMGSSVYIECWLADQQLTVSVKDEGMGINPLDAEKIFDRFYRVDNHETQYISGFGIGLYLSAEIIRHHGGRIWLESKQGSGSTFYFSIPLKAHS